MVLHNGLFVKLIKRNISINFVRLLMDWISKLTDCVYVSWNNCYGDVLR